MVKKTITIDVIADLVCPWCFIARQRLLDAIKLLQDVDIALNWKPFQLNPELPTKGKPFEEHIRAILGGQGNVDSMQRQLISLGKDVDIQFDFEAITIAPNSLNAHRAVYWAAQDKPGVQDRLVGELFSRYFEQGEDIGDTRIIVEAARNVGMVAKVVETLLQTEIDCATVKQDIANAYKIGVRGVPCMVIDKKFVVMGAQTTELLTDTIQQIANGFEPNTAQDR